MNKNKFMSRFLSALACLGGFGGGSFVDAAFTKIATLTMTGASESTLKIENKLANPAGQLKLIFEDGWQNLLIESNGMIFDNNLNVFFPTSEMCVDTSNDGEKELKVDALVKYVGNSTTDTNISAAPYTGLDSSFVKRIQAAQSEPHAPLLGVGLLSSDKLGKEVFIDSDRYLRAKDGKYIMRESLYTPDKLTLSDKVEDAVKVPEPTILALQVISGYKPDTCSYESLFFSKTFVDADGQLRNLNYELCGTDGKKLGDKQQPIKVPPASAAWDNGVNQDLYRSQYQWGAEIKDVKTFDDQNFILANKLGDKVLYKQKVTGMQGEGDAAKLTTFYCFMTYDGKKVMNGKFQLVDKDKALKATTAQDQAIECDKACGELGIDKNKVQEGGSIWWRNAGRLTKTGVIAGPIVGGTLLAGSGIYAAMALSSKGQKPATLPKGKSTPVVSTPGGAF